jgi:hypothetical protein
MNDTVPLAVKVGVCGFSDILVSLDGSQIRLQWDAEAFFARATSRSFATGQCRMHNDARLLDEQEVLL